MTVVRATGGRSSAAGRPRVSILLPALDAGGTLASCLRSIQRQTEPSWQCVIVDDGSTDDTLQCARRFAAVDGRFEVLGLPHRGLVATLNEGLAHCRGEFVARMDADDVMHRDRLAAQIAYLRAVPGLAAVGCHVRLFPRASLRDGRRAYEKWLNGIVTARDVRGNAFVECPIAHPTLVLRTAVLGDFGYRRRGWAEDYDLVLRLLAAGRDIGVVPRRLVAWRDHPARLSRNAPEYSTDRFTACKAAFLASGFLAAHQRYVLWGYGTTGRALRRELARHGKTPASIVEVHPGRIGNTINGAPVIPPSALRHAERLPLVASVAGEIPREEIRAELGAMGFRELEDFVCAA